MDGTASEIDDGQGIRLERFSRENADVVLAWRNADHVRANSLNDEVISCEDHLQFIDNLKVRADRSYFLVYLRGSPEGVLNVNVGDQIGYWGCYLGGDEKKTVRPGLFSLFVGIAGVVAFNTLDCTELRSEVLERNVPPQKMNAFLQIPVDGHRQEVRPSGEQVEVLCYVLPRKQWPSVLDRVNSTLTKRQKQLLNEFSTNPQI